VKSKLYFICVFSGRALVEVGESYKQLAEIKYSAEDNVKQNFLEPLQNLQNKDLKEVNVCIFLSFNSVYSVIISVVKALIFYHNQGERSEH